MGKVFNIYNKEGDKVLSNVTSPAKLTGLKPSTKYATGDFKVTAIEEGKAESEKVDIREFQTADAIINVESVAFKQASYKTLVGRTVQTAITITPSTATNTEVTYELLDPSFGTVNATGLVTANDKAGSVDLKVTTADGNKTATTKITINEVEVPPVDPPIES